MARNPPKQFNIPAGQYWLGDPCYSFDNSWEDLIKKSRRFGLEEGGSPLVEWKGGLVLGLTTACGCGTYTDQHGNEYPVDAGMIGLVRVGIEDRKPSGVQLINFKSPTVVFTDGSRLCFGDYVIETGDEAS